MKRIFFLMAFLLFPLFYVMADYIPTTGPWDEDDITRRSVSTAPARPIASINGTVVSVCSPDALVDLNVIITDRQGHVVYQQPHTFTAGETIDLPALEEGEYIIVLSLGRRYLLGEFEVE